MMVVAVASAAAFWLLRDHWRHASGYLIYLPYLLFLGWRRASLRSILCMPMSASRPGAKVRFWRNSDPKRRAAVCEATPRRPLGRRRRSARR